MHKDETVYVGLSGGVDSSVAALRLKNAGYNVTGVFIKVWHPDFLVCNWEQERLDAMRVAAQLDIPFLTCDAMDAYKDEVADYFISEYKAGRTPNPDVMCNRYVKFGAFLKFAEEHCADYIATGHYVQVQEKNGAFSLHRGIDTGKDQSYFLWTLTQKQLRKILLPVGDTTKSNIRKEAKKAGIPTAKKKDSQGICFLGHVDIPEFLSHYEDLKEGVVLNAKGETIGKHQGALVYTIGQRHGFTVSTGDTARQPYYVSEKSIKKNSITVSTEKPIIRKSEPLELELVNWIQKPSEKDTLEVQIRYRQTPFEATLIKPSETTATLTLNADTERPAVGQSCVMYLGSECIGGGIIV